MLQGHQTIACRLNADVSVHTQLHRNFKSPEVNLNILGLLPALAIQACIRFSSATGLHHMNCQWYTVVQDAICAMETYLQVCKMQSVPWQTSCLVGLYTTLHVLGLLLSTYLQCSS